MRRTLLPLLLVPVIVITGFGLPTAQGRSELPPQAASRVEQTPANDRARGMVFDGLRPGGGGEICDGLFAQDLADGSMACTHGPDPAPPDVDPRDLVDVESLKEDGALSTAGEGGIACIDDGSSGNRVQAIYAVASDRSDRFASVEPLIQDWILNVDRTFAESAAKTGGHRLARWVHDSACRPVVQKVVLSPTGDDNFTNMVNELKKQGFNSKDRKYLVWADANVYCGIGHIYRDPRPGPENYNDGAAAMFSRVDSGCWGRANSVEAHELMHNLGGVQPTAPNGTSGYHCSDEYDRMCYRDSSSVSLSYKCPTSHEALFDCGNDDYFHTDPPAGSYLASNWNSANSSFLTSQGASSGPPPTPDATPPATPSGLTASAGDKTVQLGWTPVSDSDLAGYKVYRNGAHVATTNDAAYTDTALTNGTTYSYRISALDHAGNESSQSSAVSATPMAPQPSITTTEFTGRLNNGNRSRSFNLDQGQGQVEAVLVTTSGGGGARGAKQSSSGETATILELQRSDGSVVATATGASGASLKLTAPAGNYVWVVNGPDGAFTLSVSHVSA